MGCGRCRDKTKIRVSTAEKLQAPVLRPDGIIQFPAGQAAPLVSGYIVDGENKSVLLPDEAGACDWKITGMMLRKGGEYKPHHVCRHSKCEHKSKPVTFDICKACPLRERA